MKLYMIKIFKLERNYKLEYCKQSFLLMDSFWVEIDVKNFHINWLVKVRGHLDKVEKEQQIIKQKKLCTVLLCHVNLVLIKDGFYVI